MAEAPESPILQLLRDMRAEMATKNDLAEIVAESRALRADVASDLKSLDAKVDATRKDLSEQIVGLRRAVIEYHTSAIGHGVLISELEARLRRVEQHLNLQQDTL
ncbi:hypothetical protein HUN39_15910 [Methylocystis sp. FS]|uniref:hypothetical protein n=1 Tax=Methylocystis silviterrae TaxID=2743612 RepID=UPI0015837842|nr:hypothetical protein [Methylocystis silviterrae]NUJ81481.1 hypothetical protein [Methylocystis silviterrae]